MIPSDFSNDALLDAIFNVSPQIRYVALKDGDILTQRQRAGVSLASASESDRYEELFVNPALIALAGARGDLDCGGFRYLVIRYGNFFQLVCRLDRGHLSVCIESRADPLSLVEPILEAQALVAANNTGEKNRPAPSSQILDSQEQQSD